MATMPTAGKSPAASVWTPPSLDSAPLACALGDGEGVGVSVAAEEGVAVGKGVEDTVEAGEGVAEGELLGVAADVGDGDAVNELLGVVVGGGDCVADEELLGVAVAEGEELEEGDELGVAVAEGEELEEGDELGVAVAEGVGVPTNAAASSRPENWFACPENSSSSPRNTSCCGREPTAPGITSSTRDMPIGDMRHNSVPVEGVDAVNTKSSPSDLMFPTDSVPGRKSASKAISCSEPGINASIW